MKGPLKALDFAFYTLIGGPPKPKKLLVPGKEWVRGRVIH